MLQCPKPVIAAAMLSACDMEGTDVLLVHDFVLQCPKPVIAAAMLSACVREGTDVLLLHDLV